MAWTPATFQQRAPAFKCVSPNAIQRGIDEAERATNRTNWGVKEDDAVFYLSAHIITLNTHLDSLGPTGALTGTPSGPITSESILEWSASYQSSNAFDDQVLASTSWGRSYIALRRTIFSRRCI